MKPSFLMCRLSASIDSQEDLAKKYQILDCQFKKKRMPVQPDGHCFLRAIFTALKNKPASVTCIDKLQTIVKRSCVRS